MITKIFLTILVLAVLFTFLSIMTVVVENIIDPYITTKTEKRFLKILGFNMMLAGINWCIVILLGLGICLSWIWGNI